MDREAWRAAVHGVAKNQTWLSDRTEKVDQCWWSKRELGEKIGGGGLLEWFQKRNGCSFFQSFHEQLLGPYYFSGVRLDFNQVEGHDRWRLWFHRACFITWVLLQTEHKAKSERVMGSKARNWESQKFCSWYECGPASQYSRGCARKEIRNMDLEIRKGQELLIQISGSSIYKNYLKHGTGWNHLCKI